MTTSFAEPLATDVEARLDVIYNYPDYKEAIDSAIPRPGYDLMPLSRICETVLTTFDPTLWPNDEFAYIDIGSVDVNTKLLSPSRLLGYDMVSSRMRRLVQSGDILLSLTRPTRGAIALVPESTPQAMCSTGFLVLRCKEGFDGRLVLRGLDSDFVRVQLLRLCSGSGYPAISAASARLNELLVPYPTTTQARLDLLRKLDEGNVLIEALSKKELANRKLLDGKFMALMSLPFDQYVYAHRAGTFGRTQSFEANPNDSGRLDFLANKPTENVLLKFYEQYHTCMLKEALRHPIFRGKQPRYDPSGNSRVLKTRHVQGGKIDYGEAEPVEDEWATEHFQLRLLKEDLLITSTGYVSLGRPCVVDKERRDIDLFVDSHISVIRLRQSYVPKFMELFLRSPLGQLQIERLYSGSSGQIEIQTSDLDRIIIPTDDASGLDRQHQEQIAEACSIIEERLTADIASRNVQHAQMRALVDENAFLNRFSVSMSLAT